MAGQPFAKEIRSVTPGTNQLSQQKPGIEMLLSRKNLWRALVSNGVDPFRRPTSTKTNKVFENVIPAQTLPAWNGRDRTEMK